MVDVMENQESAVVGNVEFVLGEKTIVPGELGPQLSPPEMESIEKRAAKAVDSFVSLERQEQLNLISEYISGPEELSEELQKHKDVLYAIRLTVADNKAEKES